MQQSDQLTVTDRRLIHAKGLARTIRSASRRLAKGGTPFFTAYLILLAAIRAQPEQIWFAPMDWFVRPEVGFGGSSDYMVLFEPGEATSILSRVKVFKLYPQFIQRAGDDDLRFIFAQLRKLHIALAAEMGILTEGERCGKGVEGYGGDGAAKLAMRIARLGGELAYLAMDEPAFYGHRFSGANACQADLADIARDAAKNLAAVKTAFPGVRAGDTEPVGPSPRDEEIEEYARWADAFRAAAGEPLAFTHADVQWKQPWRKPLRRLASLLRERKIPLGVIYNGDDDDTSDQIWVAHARVHYRAVEADSQIAPDQVVFQSWRAHPSHLLPESDPGAFTYLLREYLERQR